MTESQKTRFVDGLRVTPLHLNHSQATAEQAVRDLRGVVGLGKIGYGFRLVLSEDGSQVTLSPGLAFSSSGLRLALDEGVTLTVPEGPGPFSVVLRAENHDEPSARLDELATVIYEDTAVEVAAGEIAPDADALVVGALERGDDEALSVSQDGQLFLAPAYHGHTGAFFQDELGFWRFDGRELLVDEEGATGPAGPPGAQGPQGDPGPEGAEGRPGPQGDPGTQGPPGEQGAAGPEGAPGQTGPPGAQGATGEKGEKGDKGDPGDKGDSGTPGEKGDKGDTGAAGAGGATGPAGDAGPPGPGIGADLVRVGKIPWDPRRPVSLPEALGLLRSLQIDFTGEIDPSKAEPFADLVGWVRLQLPASQSGTPLPPVTALHGKASFSVSSFLWTLADDPGLVQSSLRNGGLIVIDLDCDYLLDREGNPVSGSAGEFVETKAFAPGGIFRTWIQVRAG